MAETAARSRDRNLVAALAATLALIVAAMAIPALTGWQVHVTSFPPLRAIWDPRVGVGTVPAIVLAVLGSLYAVRYAEALSWRRLLITVWVVGVLWMLALALVDGFSGVGRHLEDHSEYLRTARATANLPHALAVYIDRIPQSANPHWVTHLAGHPPGALTFFVVLARLGLADYGTAAVIISLLAATTAVAVMMTVRTLGAEDLARKAAPFLVLGPFALWQCASADAMFAAVAAWGIAALAVAATRTGVVMIGWGLTSGVLLGYAVMLSYGLPLLGLLAVAVLVLAGSWRPLIPTVLAACAVVGTYAAYGFVWWQALGPLHDRYWIGIAHQRPGGYFIWANLAALALSAGPLVGPGLMATFRRRVEADQGQVRVIRWLVGAAVLMVLAADASQMSKAEVERIWLPFIPWLLLGTALLPRRWRRGGLVLQVLTALLLQHLLDTLW